MSRLLPSDTDFYGTVDAPYAGVTLPGASPIKRLLPAPRSIRVDPGRVSFRLGPDGMPEGEGLRFVDEITAARSAPAHAEGYAIRPEGEDRLVIASRTLAGRRNALRTLARIASPADGGALTAPRVHAEDWPAVDIRFLGGWALCRTHGLRDAIDLAGTFMANRVLYNAWGWLPEDRLGEDDARHVEQARAQGIELVFELRRMSFGRDFSIREAGNRRTIVDAFESAAGAGLRSFGLLFDDVPWETAEDECRLTSEVLEALAKRVGGTQPEFFTCPQFYWNPGQMNAAWTGRAGAEETQRQREYLETYGRLLPQGVHVYIANYWGGHPEGYASALRSEFTDLVRRKPIFFDNQLVNDYRHGAIFPFALHSRPRDLGESYAGYYMNCGLPFSAHAASAATALAYAWNPEGYEAGSAMGAALAHVFGPSPARVERAVKAVNLLAALANEWAGGEHTALSHYATIWRQVKDGCVRADDLERWRRALLSSRETWAAALPDPSRSPPETQWMLRDTARLERDLELFRDYFEARSAGPSPEAAERFALRARAAQEAVLAAVAAILPPAPGLARLLEDASRATPLESPAWSWVEYFHSSTRRTLERVTREMLETFESSSGS